MSDLSPPSGKRAPCEPKHTPKREHLVYMPCLTLRPLQSLYGVKKYKLTKVVSIQLPARIGKQLSFKRAAPGLNALVIHAVTQKEWYGSHGILTHRKPPFPKHKRQHSLHTSDTASHPAFRGPSSLYSLILVQSPHVFVCEKIQKRNVANGLVNITHCDFFGNPSPKDPKV